MEAHSWVSSSRAGSCTARSTLVAPQRSYTARSLARSDGPLAGTLETEADRRPLPAVPQEATAGDRSGAAIRLHRGPAPEALPHEGSEPEGPPPERGVRQCLGPPGLRNEEGQDCHGESEPVVSELHDTQHHHPLGAVSDSDRY